MLLIISAILTLIMSIVHSALGELWILRPLQQSADLPALQGSRSATRRTLRFTWHITSVLGIGISAILFYFATLPELTSSETTILKIFSATYLISFAVAIVGSKGRHPSWAVFLIVGILLYLAAA